MAAGRRVCRFLPRHTYVEFITAINHLSAQTRTINMKLKPELAGLRSSWNANMVALDFPAAIAPSRVEAAEVSVNSEVND